MHATATTKLRSAPALAVLACACTLAAPGATRAEPSAQSAGQAVGVEIVPTSQARMLARRALVVEVSTDYGGRIEVSPRVRTGSRARAISKRRSVAVGAGARKRLRLPLSESGRRAVASCASKTLLVTAKLRPANPSVSARPATARVELVIDSAACEKPGQGTRARGGRTGR